MTQADLKHRLAAIVAADAAGYSRLMGVDERGTVAALDNARAVFEKHVGRNHGIVVDTAGDSVLAVFELATGAVAASLAIQQELEAAMEAVPDDKRMRFRIGVHVGEVIEKADGTVYGDGVNIAARLQARAPAGGLCVSQTVYDTVNGKLPVRGVAVGTLELKNIAKPVLAWFVWNEGDESARKVAEGTARSATDGSAKRSRRRRLSIAAAALVLGVGAAWLVMSGGAARMGFGRSISGDEGGSIAVLPFANLGDDASATNFADGIHEDLLTQLALVGTLKVVSRTSVMEYRGTRKSAQQIARELGVGALVEGSVRQVGRQVRVTAQLIDGHTDRHLWANRYDRELRDIFALQAELATQIAQALQVKLNPDARARLAAPQTADLRAYELYSKAVELGRSTQGTALGWSTLRQRIMLLDQALQLDPMFVHAWARLGVEHAAAYYSAADKTAGRQALARAAIERALALAPADPVVKIAEGNYFRMATSDQERAAAAFEQVLATAPYHVDALNGLASVRRAQGREAERALLIERALAVEPRNFGALNRLKHHHLAFRDYDRAAAYQQRIVELRPGDLDLRAKLQQIEYYRSGDWAGYGAWRATLRAGVEREIGIVHELDTRRAIARRDWNEALRLAEIEPADSRPALTDNQAAILRRVRLALVHRARSDQATAREHAHNAIRQLDQEIARAPRDLGSWELKAKMHALLGERNLAEESFAQALAVARGEGGATLEGEVRRHLLDLHAMLGDLDRANAEAARQVRLPSAFVHEWRASVELAALWDTPAFKALVADPASNAPLPVPGRQQ